MPIDYGSRLKLGVLLPSGNQAAEAQFKAMLPEGVSLHTTRLKLAGGSQADLLAMTERLEDAVGLVADCDADLIVFHCTAVATYSKELEQSIKARMGRVCGKPVAMTSEAIVAALHALQARRIVMLSPYTEAIDRREADYFIGAGFEVLGMGGPSCTDAAAMMAITPEQWTAHAQAAADVRADAYLLSCTTVRTAEVVAGLEQSLGRPVITSNTATAWHCMRRMGIEDRIDGFGRLLALH